MKKIKSLLVALIALVLFGGVTNVKAEGKVKVYMFVAGGCPYCEYEKEYLKSLDSYNVKFEIVEKQLYKDHVDWKPAKDYPLGKAVAEAFLSAGFENASYNGTPFVVISDLYAAAAYSTELDKVINEAYEKGDKDVVACYANDGENCLEGADPSIKVDWSLVPEEESEDEAKKVDAITTVILLLIIGGIAALITYNERKKQIVEKEEETKEEKVVKEAKKEVTKKVKPAVKETKKTGAKKEKTPAKKATKKTTKKK